MKPVKDSWSPSDLYDAKTGRPIDTLYFRATIPADEALIDEAEERFMYILHRYVCYSLPGDPDGSYRLSRRKFYTLAEVAEASQAMASFYAGKVRVLNLMPFEEAVAYYVRHS